MKNTMTQRMKKSLALLLAFVLVMSTGFSSVAAPKKSKDTAPETEQTQQTTQEQLTSAEGEQLTAEETTDIPVFEDDESTNITAAHEQPIEALYADDDIVTVIVELEAAPVLDDYNNSDDVGVENEDATSGEAVSEYLASDDAQEKSEELISDQDEVTEKIKKIKKDKDNKNSKSKTAKSTSDEEVEVIAQWTCITNAMAVRVPYGMIGDIEALDEVKRAYVQHVYEEPAPQDDTLDLSKANYEYSLDMAGVSEVWAKGYTGKGLLVAVLDTGIDVIQDKTNGKVLGSHEAFSDDSFMSEDVNLRYTEESITEFVENNKLYANTSTTSGNIIIYDNNALYKNLKVPFGYNYADWNVHTRPSSNFHGVHVSGTVAGYAESDEGEILFSGAAPDAQILAMKVFSEQGGGAEEVAIVSALEDSMALGADIINLSLGSDNGFSEDNTMQNEIYARVEASGIVLMTSAGNSADSSTYNNYDSKAYIENPDNSMMSSPAVYDSNLSVASIENVIQVNSYLNYKIGGGSAAEAYFSDTTGLMKGDFADKEYPVYLVGGTGTWNDYYNVGFNNGYNGGKDGIALVKRGEISFAEKINNAMSFAGTNSQGEPYGVIAVIIYDNDPESDELINMSVDGTTLDSCFISGRDGAAMAAALEEGKSVTIQTSKVDKTNESPNAYQMSSFSSWGSGAALELKPEITAPGGNVWSSIVDTSASSDSSYTGTYEMMSGTSMAAPHMSGIGALIRQRVTTSEEFKSFIISSVEDSSTDTGSENSSSKDKNSKDKNKNNKDKDKNKKKNNKKSAQAIGDVVSQLLVSTAIPQKDPNGNYYSPRLQGAGLVSASAAAETPVFISVDGQNTGKLELGDDPKQKGSYKFDFTLHNVSKSDITYDVSLVLLRPETGSVSTEWGDRDVMETSDVEIKTVNLKSIKVKAGTDTKYSGSASLTKNEIKELKNLFPNGTYVEGYVILKDQKGKQPDLTVPMLSFFGDWTKAPIFDSATWLEAENFEDQETNWAPNLIGSQQIYDGQVLGYFDLAENPYATEDQPQTIYHEANITLSPDGNGYMDAIDNVMLYQIRNARVIVFEAKNKETGEVYFRDFASYLPKSQYQDNYGFVVPWSLMYAPVWDGMDHMDENGNLSDEGTPLPSGTKCTYTISAYGDGDYSMFGTTWDEYYGMDVINYAELIPGEKEPLFNGHKMDMTGDVISFDVTIDTQAPKLENNAVSVYEQDGRTYITGKVHDEDGSLASTTIYPIVKRTYKEGYGNPEYYEYGMDRINPFYCNIIYDAGKNTLEFTADVTEYTHTNQSYPGENNYYDFTWEGNLLLSITDYGINERNYMISVNAAPGLVLSQTSALLHPGDEFDLSVNDNTAAEGTISRTSSNPEVATIDEYGHITAVASGQTVITVSKGSSSAICVVAVEERKTEVIDFDLSIDNIENLKPDGQAQVRVTNLYPADVEIQEIRWEVSEDDDYAEKYAEGLITIEKNSSDALSGNLYLNVQQSNELLPSGHATLTVTINDVSRKADVTWQDIYTEKDQDDLVPTVNYGEQVIYVNQGESAELGAKYRQTKMHEIGDIIADLTGLKLDGADFFMKDGSYSAKLVNEEGYALPESIRMYTKYTYSDGSTYESERDADSPYGYYYNSNTGEITVQYAPTGNASLRIVAEGAVSEGNPAGEVSDTTYEKPEPLYGPFNWAVKDGDGKLETFQHTESDGSSYEMARYTPDKPGVSYITVTTKDNTMSLEYAVVSLPIQADTLELDTHAVDLTVGGSQTVKAVLSPDPTLKKDLELIWTSFNEDVAVVEADGTITAKSSGHAFIKVESKANTKVSSYVVVHVTGN